MWLLIKWYSLLSTRNLIRSKQNKIIKMVTCMSIAHTHLIHNRFTSPLSPIHSLSLPRFPSLFFYHMQRIERSQLWSFPAPCWISFVRLSIREEAPANLFHKFIWIYGACVACKHSWLVSFSPNSCRLNIAHMPSSLIQFRAIFAPSPLHII